MPEENKTTPVSGRAAYKIRKKIGPLLESWYEGASDTEASGALMKFLPQSTTMADALQNVVRKKIPPYMMVIFELRDNWQDIVGAVSAKRTMPVRYKNGVLDVEVLHPAYLAALSSKTIKDAILTKVRQYQGAADCTQIRFVPAGGMERPH